MTVQKEAASIQQVTIKRATELLGYSRAHLYKMMDRGEIRSVGQGRLRRIPLAELQRWQQQRLG